MLEYFKPKFILAKGGLDTGDSGMHKKFKFPRAIKAETLASSDLAPPDELFIQRQTFATEPSSSSIIEPTLGTSGDWAPTDIKP